MTASVEPQINIEAGHTATFTPDSSHQRWDGEMGDKTATWSTAKGNQVVTVNPAAMVLNISARSTKFTMTRKGDGVTSATSNNQSVATVDDTSQITEEMTVDSVKDIIGTTTITIKVTEGGNYLTDADRQVQIKV